MSEERSPRYKLLKGYYGDGYWAINMVRNAVVKKWITEEEFFLITGQEYNTTE